VSTLGTVLLALIVPVAWGVLSAWLFDKIRLRRECNQTSNAKAESQNK